MESSMLGVDLGHLLIEAGSEILEGSNMDVEFRMQKKLVDDSEHDISLTALAVSHQEDFLALRHTDWQNGYESSARNKNGRKISSHREHHRHSLFGRGIRAVNHI